MNVELINFEFRGGGNLIDSAAGGCTIFAIDYLLFWSPPAVDFALLNVWVVGFVGERWGNGSWHLKESLIIDNKLKNG